MMRILVVPALLMATLLSGGCSSEDDGPRLSRQDPEEEVESTGDADAVIDAALLTEEDVEGLEAVTWDTWSDPLDDCKDVTGDSAEPEEARFTIFRAGEQLVFQDVAVFRDEDTAISYANTQGGGLGACFRVREAEPRDPGDLVDDVSPMDLDEADLGEHAYGWRIDTGPQEFEGMTVTGVEAIVAQRGPVVVVLFQFVPLSELDIVELAELTYERLPD